MTRRYRVAEEGGHVSTTGAIPQSTQEEEREREERGRVAGTTARGTHAQKEKERRRRRKIGSETEKGAFRQPFRCRPASLNGNQRASLSSR